MRFDPMIFAELRRCARSIEVAERNEVQSVNLTVPAQDFLEAELRFAVGINRSHEHCFINRNSLGRTEDGAGRGENNLGDADAHQCIEKVQTVSNVVPKIFRWILHRFTN